MSRQVLVSTLLTLVFVATCLAGSPEPRLQPAEQAKTGTITGKVLDCKDKPVAGAIVILCDQKSGVPVSTRTFRPFTEAFLAEKGDAGKDIACAVTDAKGSFSLEKISAGQYRLVAQSWKDADEIKGIFEKNGKEIELHGVAEHVKVSGEISPNVVLGPLGTGILQIDQDVPNDEVLLVISTQPTRADPILGFAGWGGAFMQNMIGGNRMRKGETTVYGLPEGKVYLAMFAADSVPGWTEGQADIRPDTTTVLPYIPFVNSWSNSRHDPPERLRPLFEEMKSLRQQNPPPTEDHPLVQFYDLLAKEKPEGIWWWQQLISSHLDHQFELPSGRKATFGDIEAVRGYIDLQEIIKRRNEQRRRRQEIAEMKTPVPEGQKRRSYEEAFLDLYRELGERYPCFELKQIDWKAVGEELLPRVTKVKSDAEFGLLCMELVARLEDSHAHLLEGSAKPPQISFPQWDPGFACLEDDQGRPLVYYVDQGGPAEQTGIKVGMVVVSINGEKAKDAVIRTMNELKKYVGYSSERYLRYHAHRFFIRQKERAASVKLEMLDGQEKVHNFELPANLGVRYLPRLPVPSAGIQDAGSVSWKMLDGQIGYIYVRRIRGDLIELLDKAVGELKNARGLIVDVRGNSGGGFDFERAPLNFALDRDSEEPQRPRYKGPMALVIDSRCISAGEGWASWFVANERARVFGEATAGASSRKTVYELKNGLYKVRFPVKAYKGYLDRPIERVGLVPDVPVRQNAQDLIKGRDTVLETAKLHLMGKTTTMSMSQEYPPIVQWAAPVDGLSLGIEVPQCPFIFMPVKDSTGPIIIREADAGERIVRETSNAGGHWDRTAIVSVHLRNNSAEALFWSKSPAVWSVSFSGPHFEQPPSWPGPKPAPVHGEPICLNPTEEAVMTFPMSGVFDIWPSVPTGDYTITVSYSPNQLLKYARGGEGNWTHPFDVPGFWTGTVATPRITVRVEHTTQAPNN